MISFKRENLTGIRFGKLIAIEPFSSKKWVCKCDCGKIKNIYQTNLKQGYSKSCGCVSYSKLGLSQTKHGMWVDEKYRSEYCSWQSAKGRCCNPLNEAYKNYGFRGIRMCERWVNSFENFIKDMGLKPTSKHSLDRYPDMNGSYEPSNCRWATCEEQQANRRNNKWFEYDGVKMIMQDWSKAFKVTHSAIYFQMKKNGNDFNLVAKHYIEKNRINKNEYKAAI